MRRSYFAVVAVLALAFFAGCLADAPDQWAAPAAAPVSEHSKDDDKARGEPPEEAADPEQMGHRAALVNRKLIRTGEVTVRVKSVDDARRDLEARVTAAGGYVADVLHQRAGGNRQLNITLRLPAEGFGDFLHTLRNLGVLESERVTVQDVTDSWIDLRQRIATKEKLAARLEQQIAEKTYRFRDLLEVEKELARLRYEIESLKGQLHGMDDRVAYSTLQVHLYQEVMQKIAPPDSVFAPLLNAMENAGPHFKGSLRALMAFFGGVITVVVVMAPWLLLAGLGILILVAIIRRTQRRSRRSA
ncbi:MAG: DUF4349 domain-containing protein [Candidatus Lernaella stagnicola]|nr:DUF4349 domain-containing protein [Candidatus Lernaella stagnicola]